MYDEGSGKYLKLRFEYAIPFWEDLRREHWLRADGGSYINQHRKDYSIAVWNLMTVMELNRAGLESTSLCRSH
jgi:hypothetical protein